MPSRSMRVNQQFLTFFIHSFLNVHISYFHVLTNVNKPAVNVECRFLFKIVFTFPSHICPEVGLMDHMVTIFNHPIVKPMCVCMCPVTESCVSLRPHGLQPTRVLCPWNFLGMKMSKLPFPTLGDFSAQRLIPCLLLPLHWQADTLPLCHLGSPIVKPMLTSRTAALIYIPTNCAQGFLFLHSLTNTYCPPLLTSYITIVHLPKLKKPTSVHY